MKKILLLLMTLLMSGPTFTQTTTKIKAPNFKDEYSSYVRRLESGDTDIDYQKFRFSFLESQQFVIANANTIKFDSLKREMYAGMKTEKYAEIIQLTKQMLGIDYTSMLAHKILRQTYNIIGDTTNAAKHKKIQFGLLNSIVENGNGQTCATAWPVIQISEEYFILEMLGADLQKQSIDHDGGICDQMRVEVDGKVATYYFEVSKVFLGYKKLGLE